MKKIANIVFSACIVLSAVSCITMQPPEDPARRAALEQKFSAKSKVYGSKGTYKHPASWKVGQYVVTGMSENGIHKSVARTAIVGKENGGYILEIMSEDARQKTGQQMLVKGLDDLAKGDNSVPIEILWMRILGPDGKVQKMDGAMLSMMTMTMKSTLNKMFNIQTDQSEKGGTITVPGGTFKRTTKIDSEASVMGMSFKSTVYAHPAVPINGTVRTETSNGKSVTELLDFGKSGAKPSF